MAEPTTQVTEPTVEATNAQEEVEEGEEEDWTDQFPFDVHFAVSKGKNTYTIDEVVANEDGSFKISISSEYGDKVASGDFTAAEVAEIQTHFEEEEAAELVGNCFCTVESYAEHALEELKLLGSHGKARKIPADEEIHERVAVAFAKLADPDFSTNFTGGDKWRYFINLFDLNVFENDPVAAAWVDRTAKRVHELSAGKVIVTPASHSEFPGGERPMHSLRDILLKITDGEKTRFVQICPATNGYIAVE